jgi:hypothetical protein
MGLNRHGLGSFCRFYFNYQNLVIKKRLLALEAGFAHYLLISRRGRCELLDLLFDFAQRKHYWVHVGGNVPSAQGIQALGDAPEGLTREYTYHSHSEICGPEYDIVHSRRRWAYNVHKYARLVLDRN